MSHSVGSAPRATFSSRSFCHMTSRTGDLNQYLSVRVPQFKFAGKRQLDRDERNVEAGPKQPIVRKAALITRRIEETGDCPQHEFLLLFRISNCDAPRPRHFTCAGLHQAHGHTLAIAPICTPLPNPASSRDPTGDHDRLRPPQVSRVRAPGQPRGPRLVLLENDGRACLRSTRAPGFPGLAFGREREINNRQLLLFPR